MCADPNVALVIDHCNQSQVDIEKVFGKNTHSVVAKLNIEGQHRGAVAAARSMQVCTRMCYYSKACIRIALRFARGVWLW